MRIKCEYCGGFIDDSEEICKHCGATNSKLKRVSNGVPKTIEELKSWYKQQNLPPKEVTRFFIGEDYKYPKAFGIYKNEQTGNFIVYKNKADGSRAIRYSGKDEAYAVNEIYMKLKEEILKQKANNVSSRQKSSTNRNTSNRNTKNKNYARRGTRINVVTWFIFVLIFIITIFFQMNKPNRGYYNYNGNHYYYLDSSWYSYDKTTDSWGKTTVDDDLHDNYDDYYESSYYNDSYDVSDFSNTTYYDDWLSSSSSSSSNSSSSWDSGSSWDNDSSWDSGWDSSDSWGDSGGWDSDW